MHQKGLPCKDDQSKLYVNVGGQEADACRVLMHNATRVDLTVNQGRDERAKDHHGRILAVIKRVDDLSPTMYMQTLAKLITDK